MLSKYRRFIFAAVGIIVLILLIRSGLKNDVFTGAQNKVSGWVSYVASASERRSLNALQDRFLRNNMALQPHQTDYVYKVTQSVDSVRTFNALYCENDDVNPYLYGNSLMKFCSDISASRILDEE